jgi:hypothetical protein
MLAIEANTKKLLMSTVTIALLCALFISSALAAPDDNRAQAANSPALTDDGQMLIAPAPQDDAATTSDGNPMLIQPRDTNMTDDSATPTDAQSEDDANLIATNTNTDNTLIVVGAMALAAIAVGAGVAVVRLRKK